MSRKPRYVNHGRDIGPHWKVRRRLVIWYFRYCDEGEITPRKLAHPWKLAR